MRLSYKFNELCHSFFEKRVHKAYNKKVDKRLKMQSGLANKVDPEITNKHLELYGRLGLPCSDKWLRLYSNLTGEIDYRYLPEDLFFCRIERVLNNCDRANAECEDKNLLSKFVEKKYMPKIYVRYIRGIFFDEDYNYLSPQRVDEILAENHGRLIGKPAVDSLGGHAVQAFSFVDGLYVSSGCERLNAEWIASQGESYIIQELVQQSDFSKQFNPASANTCRITTLRCPWNGEVVACKASMRFGVTDTAVDNMASGGIATGLSRSGELGPYAYSWNGMKKYDRHPSSGVVFKGLIHPEYKKMCEAVIAQAKLIPNFNLMSWDVITNQDGDVKILEVNLVSEGTDILQFAFGSFFGEYTEPLIDWVATHKHLDTFKHLRTF